MGKSSKHKSENVHHFLSFSERISNVNIDVIHRIRRIDDETEGTYFGEALAKWTELDLTDNFCDFRREISGQVQTYEQLVHHKAEIISSLKKHLSLKESKATTALLNLVVQLAKDLQQDFVPHFQEFFKLLTQLLITRAQDADAMEQTFQALASLFRVLWRFLIKDFKEVFGYYSHLLKTSQKDYIKVFAAESCAYLLRKVKKQDELFNFLFGMLKASPELTDGIGLLLFEMVKGVKNHFHTASEQVLPLILQKLGPWNPSGKKQISLPRQQVEQAVTVCLQECAELVDKENSRRLWEILLDCISSVNQACAPYNDENDTKEARSGLGLQAHLGRLLKVTSQLISHKSGAVVWDGKLVATTLCKVTSTAGVEQDVLSALSSLLEMCQEAMPVDMVVKIMTSIFTAPFCFKDLKTFALSCIDMPFFEKDILPRMLTPVCEELSKGERNYCEVMTFLIEVVLHKTTAPVTGDAIDLLKPYPLDRSWSRTKSSGGIASHVETQLRQMLDKTNLTPSDLPSLWGLVVCLPHLSIKNNLDICSMVWVKLLGNLNGNKEKLVDESLPVLNQTLKSMIFIAQEKQIDKLPIKCEDVFEILKCQPKSCISLQILDFYLSFQGNAKLLTEPLMHQAYPLLEQNLVSPSHNVRLLSCHILSLFPFKLQEYGDDIVRESAFVAMYKAEQMEPTVHNYREKLIHLRKMEHDFAAKCLPEGISVKTCLLFVLGNKFWNFKLLWEPLGAIATSYALAMDTKEFWDTVLDQLVLAAGECEKDIDQLKVSQERVLQGNEENYVANMFISYWATALQDSRPPDFLNYRMQLWKTLKKFPEKCVLRSDELCQLYMQFLSKEFSTADEDTQSFQNILEPSKQDGSEGKENTLEKIAKLKETVDEDENDLIEDENNGDESEDDMDISIVEKGSGSKAGKMKRKSRVQSLLVHLGVFSQFKKQRAMFNQKNVQDTFFDFLKHRNAAIQKAAFDCIMTYKSPHLLPYRDNFYRLLDDKTFKSEITLFSVDEETNQVKSEDRKGLLPVLMRILYGKMHGKTGNDTAGKANSNIRRTIVFGFLSGCQPHELHYFLELLFQPCMRFVTDDPLKMVHETKTTLNLKKFIPLKRIKGILNTLQTVSKRWGHRLGEFSHHILHMLLGLTSLLDTALAQRHLVVAGAIKMLKSLRHTVINRITQFFETFEDLDYSASDLEAVFEATVWPHAEKLVYEGVHHPTPLLKLLQFWSQHNRFLPLLGHKKAEENNEPVTSLGCVLDLLNAPTVAKTVVASVLEILANIVQDEEEDNEQAQEDLTLMKALPEPFVFPNTDSGGLQPKDLLLQPYVPKLLSYLKRSLSKMSLSVKDKKSTALVELKILAKMSRLVTAPEDCRTLCDLLVPYLSRGTVLTQEIEENTLLSLTNLIQHIEEPSIFIKPVAQLFAVIERRESRNLLCKIFNIICEKDEKMKEIAALVHKLNAWDKRKAEEPDYLVRLKAFTEVSAVMSRPGHLEVNILLPIIYNSCHFIYAIDDLSIRDNSTNCLVKIVERLANSAEEKKIFTSILEQTLVPQVKLGIRHKSEAVRHEFLAVLQSLVMNCKNHPMFDGLADLCDKDPEADFFENIRHIQIYKRSRALRRMYKHLKDHKFRASVHMSYVVPLIYTFVTDPSYSKHANVQDAAIDLLGAVCRQLPWPQYLQMLRFYLKLLTRKIDQQRQIIRIIVALLDAFHFDLRNSTFKVRTAPKVLQHSKKDDDVGAESKDEREVPETTAGETEQASQMPEVVLDEPMQGEEDEEELPLDLGGEELMEVEGEVADGKNEDTDNGKVVCSEVAATRIHKMVSLSLIPQLHRVITQRTKSDDEHKLVKSKYPEDEEILRVPIALALIKLLQSLPQGTLEYTLPGILLKICNFLRSRSRDVRTTARETLEKVALSLGCRYIPFIIKEMRAVLTRGYQLHVLSFTVHHLLKSLAEVLQPGDLDPALSSIQDVFYAELFGHVAEEKEVEAIKAKYFEAKFIKGYDAYGILARCISAEQLDRLILPVKSVLETTYSQRVANKAETLLHKVAVGLSSNPSMPLDAMMVFIHSLTTALVEQATQGQERKTEAKPEVTLQPGPLKKRPESCLLLEAAAPRGGTKPKANKKTNVHLIIEFGLQLLYIWLKKESLNATEHLHLQMLDPLVPTMRHLLTDVHVKTSANAMRCLSWLLHFPLPSLKKNIKQIAEGMFVVLQNYAGASTAKGGNQELITMCFKAVTTLVRDVPYHQITEQQLQVLLTYCEEDLYSHARQSTAFSLVKAILSRKLDTPQLHQVMDRLFEMSITASAPNVRLQSRQVLLHYLMNYPLGKSLKKNLQFYIDHLEYEMDEGRRSAVEMMISMFTAFPTKILNNHCPRFFTALAMASFNDSDVGCRKLISVALKSLIGKVDLKRRKALFASVISWMKSDDLRVRAMGCQVCGIFVEVEGGKFQFYVAEVLPLLQQQMEPGRYHVEGEAESEDPSMTESRDICLLAVLNLALKVLRELGVVREAKFSEDLEQIWSHVSSHLLYPHIQVRLAASQLLGMMLSAWEPAQVVQQHQQQQQNSLENGHSEMDEMTLAEEEKKPTEAQCILTLNPIKALKNFTSSICQQLKSPSLDDALATQAVKILLYLARLAEAVEAPATLTWLAKRVIKEANMEVVNNVKLTIRRNHLFKWVAAVGVSLQPSSVELVLPIVLPAVQRELADQSQDQELKNLAQEVTDLLKKQVGIDVFTNAFASSQQKRFQKREVRKRQLAEEAVTNPDIAARKKIRHNLKKRETRKRKLAEKKPHKRVKKNKLSILNVKVDEDD